MGVSDGGEDLEAALGLVYRTYSMRDPRAASMRALVGFALERVARLNEALSSAVARWENYCGLVARRGGKSLQAVIDDLGDDGRAYRALQRWSRGVGVLIMKSLEDMLEHVQRGRSFSDFQAGFEQRMGRFIERGYPGGIAAAVARTMHFFHHRARPPGG